MMVDPDYFVECLQTDIIDDSIGFESLMSQSACTDLEAWHQIND